MIETNREIFNRVGGSYVDLALKPAEQAVLRRLAPDLHDMDMLDIGVGTGRTGYTFAPLVRRYVGVDYAPTMLAVARRVLADEPNVRLIDADARDLTPVDGEFDIALFSFNGIDAVPWTDRATVLDQVRSKLRPGGWFLFSSHSLRALPLPTRKERSPHKMTSPWYRLLARADDWRYGIRVRRVNRGLALDEARQRGWTSVRVGHGFTLEDVYVDAEHQVRMLEEHGFVVDTIYDVAAKPVALPYRDDDPWLHYLCRTTDSRR